VTGLQRQVLEQHERGLALGRQLLQLRA
jgi:hypothetical protein